MKKRVLCVLIIAVCLFITACGSSSPYLKTSERAKLVEGIVADCKVTLDDNYYYLLLTNNSEYEIWDFSLYNQDASTNLAFIGVFPKGATYEAYINADGIDWDTFSKGLNLAYTIDDFFYVTRDVELPAITTEENCEIELFVETREGKVALEPGVTNFEADSIMGLGSASILSINYADPGESSGVYSPDIFVTGMPPADDGDVSYKVVDENGVVWDKGDVGSYSDTWEDEALYIFFLEPGTYTLLFDERG